MPSVIEPSFGIGRVLYSLLEHSFSQRKGDEQVRSKAPCISRYARSADPIGLSNRPSTVDRSHHHSHAYTHHNEITQRCVMAFKPAVAPIKAGVYPLLNKPEFQPFTEQIVQLLTEAGALDALARLSTLCWPWLECIPHGIGTDQLSRHPINPK